MRYHVLVDSRDRDFDVYPTPSSYRVRLPKSYKQVTAARLLSADIPASFYVFSADHGTTTLDVSVSGVPAQLVIPDGNYDTDSMCAQLGASLRAAYPSKTFTVTVSARTMQLEIACTQGDAVAVDTTAYADAPATDWGLGYYLGFPRGAVTAGAPDLTSPGMVNMNPFTYILLDIEELGTVDEGGMYGDVVGRGCFCKLPVYGTSFEYIFRDADTATKPVDCRPPIAKLETLTVRFRLHNGKLVDFRDVEHSFLLELITKDVVQPHSYTGLGAAAGRLGAAPPPLPAPPAPLTRAVHRITPKPDEKRYGIKTYAVWGGLVAAGLSLAFVLTKWLRRPS